LIQFINKFIKKCNFNDMKIINIKLIHNRLNNIRPGFCIITFNNNKYILKLIQLLNYKPFKQRSLFISLIYDINNNNFYTNSNMNEKYKNKTNCLLMNNFNWNI